MIPTTVLLAALLAAPAMGDTAKQQAPVRVEASLAASGAELTITFLTAAQGVEVRLGGTDGLKVSGAEAPIQGGVYTAGQQVKLAVGFTPGPGQSHLAVFVSGTFHGQRRVSARSFAVGKKSAAQLAVDRAGLQTDSRGQKVRVMQAGTH
jgi:hypothetical protein